MGIPISGGLNLGPHRRRRYVKPEAPETPPEETEGAEVAKSTTETENVPENGSSDVEVPQDLTKVADLLEWVGDDKARAQAVLDQEQAKPESEVRVTLVSKLTSILEVNLI